MTGAMANLLLLLLIVLGAAVCIIAPLAVLGVMFWHWRKELAESARLRQARTTQVR
jgi:MFS superfamily sulfate permease-like transporter